MSDFKEAKEVEEAKEGNEAKVVEEVEMLEISDKRCGYVALLGRPNAGKSTLLNALLGHKLAAVSAKPQTTRNRILGVHSEANTQILFLDTPGIHRTEKLYKLNKTMNRVAWHTLKDADAVCYLVDATAGWHEEDNGYFAGIMQRTTKPVVVIASKVDAVKKDIAAHGMESIYSGVEAVLASLPEAESVRARTQIKSPFPFPLSSKRPEFVAEFRTELLGKMPLGPWLFHADDLTDLPQQFVCAELIREQLFRKLSAELPYSVGVKLDSFKHEKKLTRIQATIIVQRESHKGMIIGKGGQRLKEVGTAARESLEKHLERKVFLELFVKLQEGWIDNDALISEFASLTSPE